MQSEEKTGDSDQVSEGSSSKDGAQSSGTWAVTSPLDNLSSCSQLQLSNGFSQADRRPGLPDAERWEANLVATRAYVEQNGGRHPHSRSACAEERKLGAWRETQRKRRRGQGTCAALSAAQVQQLEQVPGWSWAGWGRAELDAPRGLPPALGISALHPGATQVIEPREVD